MGHIVTDSVPVLHVPHAAGAPRGSRCGKLLRTGENSALAASSPRLEHENANESRSTSRVTTGMTRALMARVMRSLRRLASLLLVASFLGAAAQTLCAAVPTNGEHPMACDDAAGTSFDCCCDLSAPMSTPPESITGATLIAEQAPSQLAAVALPSGDDVVRLDERFGTHRPGPPTRLTILHSSLLL
jgi:hypothetical protein